MPNYAVMFQGHQREASQRYGGKYDIQPVWGHKFNGKSERKIHQTKESLKKVYQIKYYLYCNGRQ